MIISKTINIIIALLFSSTISNVETIILKQSAKDNSIVLNRFIFENPRNDELLFTSEITGLKSLDSNRIDMFDLNLSESKYSSLFELDSFQIRTVITQVVLIDDIERAVLIRDTVVIKKPYNDTIFIEINLPKYKLPDGN